MVMHQIDVDKFGSLTAYNEHNDAVQLSTLWQKGPAVLVFVRHLGWVICRQQVAELAGHEHSFSNGGAQLAVISNAKTIDLKKFREITGYQGTLLTDPSRESYKLLQFKSDLTDLIGIKSFTQTFSAFKAGFMPGALQGNALQLGGAVVIDPEDNIKYFFQSSKAGDHPSIEDLLKAIE